MVKRIAYKKIPNLTPNQWVKVWNKKSAYIKATVKFLA